MKANIIWGGLLGIALGAGAVFGLAHPMSSNEHAVEAPVRSEAADDADVVVEEVSAGAVRLRPLRPGSQRIGHPVRQS